LSDRAIVRDNTSPSPVLNSLFGWFPAIRVNSWNSFPCSSFGIPHPVSYTFPSDLKIIHKLPSPQKIEKHFLSLTFTVTNKYPSLPSPFVRSDVTVTPIDPFIVNLHEFDNRFPTI
jgi:hypothetical protein